MGTPEHGLTQSEPPPIPKDKPTVTGAMMVGLAVWLLVVVTATLITFILPESYVSTARVSVSWPASAGSPPFIQTEFEVIQSEVVLGKVIADLKLNEEWGKRYNPGGGPLKTRETFDLVRRGLDLHAVPNTGVIAIRFWSPQPREAAAIANSVAETYQRHREQQRQVAGVTGSAVVGIIEHGTPASDPARPDKPFNIVVGILVGVLAGGVIGLAVYWLQRWAGRGNGGKWIN